ncbi:MAG TPA: alkaline phosphatase family protein, partial [Candidatus Polarisedimenticolia bacterium]|nr:alkaline phosphatase family protein [Candidatus Polarisedimenticolia bacterium]
MSAGPRGGEPPSAPPAATGSRRVLNRALATAALGTLLLGLAVPRVLVQVGAGSRVFRVAPARGEAERLGPGWHLVIPPFRRVVRLTEGPIHESGTIPVQSREGAAFAVPFEISAEVDDAPLAALLARSASARRRPGAILGAAASDAVTSWSRAVSGEGLVLFEGERQVEEAIRRALETQGFSRVTVQLGRLQGPADLLASVGSQALRERTVKTGTKIAILGLDGADWEIIDPLIAQGRLPNLARLKARGAWGNMKSMYPMLSPLLWTSVATGKPPEDHGIIDFLAKDARTGQEVPVTSRWRKVKALWNIFSDAGVDSAFVAWWATWPAEEVRGHMVSDRVAYSLFGYQAGAGDRAGATWPPEYYRAIRPEIVDDALIPFAEVRRFADITAEEFAGFRGQILDNPKTAYRLPVNHLTRILASQRSYQAIGLDLLRRGQPDLFSIYYQGIDEVCHRFAHYMPPKMAMVSEGEYARYHDAVFAYYRFQDALLGEVVRTLSPDTTIIVLSDHGFRNGSDRPPNDPPFIEGKPGLWHRRYGILILSGPAIHPGRLDTA